MQARAEIAGGYARALREGVEEGQEAGILDEVCAVAAWSQDNALSAMGDPHSAAMDKPTHP